MMDFLFAHARAIICLHGMTTFHLMSFTHAHCTLLKFFIQHCLLSCIIIIFLFIFSSYDIRDNVFDDMTFVIMCWMISFMNLSFFKLSFSNVKFNVNRF